jgi:hypothetical protein
MIGRLAARLGCGLTYLLGIDPTVEGEVLRGGAALRP